LTASPRKTPFAFGISLEGKLLVSKRHQNLFPACAKRSRSRGGIPPPTPPKEGRSHSRFVFPRGNPEASGEMGVSSVFIIFVFVYVNVFVFVKVFVTVKPFPL
jgi:hypothetical protein